MSVAFDLSRHRSWGILGAGVSWIVLFHHWSLK